MTAYLLDSSVLIAMSQGRSPALLRQLSESVQAGTRLMLCEPVVMEYLAGVPLAKVAEQERFLNSFPSLPLDPHRDFRAAGALFATLRAHGITVRGIVDCLIAVVAMAAGDDVTLLHDDRDFEAMARVSALRQERVTLA